MKNTFQVGKQRKGNENPTKEIGKQQKEKNLNHET